MAGEAESDKGPLLGRQVSGSEVYAPELLFPVPRQKARRSLPQQRFAAYGEDIWHAYELSWLDRRRMPQMFVGVLAIPASSPNLVESKSLKLYLNSLNNHPFDDMEQARATICEDIASVAGASVELSLYAPGADALRGVDLGAECIDHLEVSVPAEPERGLLVPTPGDARLCTHLLRSRCPVTNQPDWATVVVETRGASPQPEGLLAYLLAYRNHQEFHEQCVERIFADLQETLQPAYLSVHALYTRRGGLDISPWRCSEERPAPRYRIDRQ